MFPKIVTFSISCRTFWWPNCISNLPFFFFSKWSRTCLALKVNWVNQELHKTFYSIRVIKNCLTEKTSTQFQSLSCERKNMPPSQSNMTILSNSSHKWLQHKLKMCCGLLIFFFFFPLFLDEKIRSWRTYAVRRWKLLFRSCFSPNHLMFHYKKKCASLTDGTSC